MSKYVKLMGIPDPLTFNKNNRNISFGFTNNNISNSIWIADSDLIISGNYNFPGVMVHTSKTIDLALKYTSLGLVGKIVHLPKFNVIVYVQNASNTLTNTSNIRTVNYDPLSVDPLNGATPITPTFSTSYNDIAYHSSSADELITIHTNGDVRFWTYNPKTNSFSMRISFKITNLVGDFSGSTYGGTAAWDGKYLYIPMNGSSGATTSKYVVYNGDGSLLNTYDSGMNNINSMYFDWSVGRYAVHDGYGAYAVGSDTLYGSANDDSQTYSVISPYHKNASELMYTNWTHPASYIEGLPTEGWSADRNISGYTSGTIIPVNGLSGQDVNRIRITTQYSLSTNLTQVMFQGENKRYIWTGNPLYTRSKPWNGGYITDIILPQINIPTDIANLYIGICDTSGSNSLFEQTNASTAGNKSTLFQLSGTIVNGSAQSGSPGSISNYLVPIEIYGSSSNLPIEYRYNTPGTATINTIQQLKQGDSIKFFNTNVGVNGTILEWTVPLAGKWKIEVGGAQGGGNGGYGGKVTAFFNLAIGQTLRILVGQKGLDSNGSGGGGGTYVVDKSTTNFLLIAGGGGGNSTSFAEGKGGISLNGAGGKGLSSDVFQSIPGQYGFKGSSHGASGGAGWLSNGQDYSGSGYGEPNGGGGKSFNNGGTGGIALGGTYNGAGSGGFGGGGGGYVTSSGGGGGGGYTGGTGSSDYSATGGGGGGASAYDALLASSVTAVAGSIVGHGYVVITAVEVINTPLQPIIVTRDIGNKNFGDIVNLEWVARALPTQPSGVILDETVVYYEVALFPDSNNLIPIIMASNILDLTTSVKLNSGGTISSVIGIRCYVLYQGKKFYGSYSYTNPFSIGSVPSDAVLPSALMFNGINTSVIMNNRIIPATGDFTIEFSFKTKSARISCLLSIGRSGGLEVFVNSSGGITIYPKGMDNNTTSNYKDSIQTGLNDGKSHKLSIVYYGNNILTYIDGLLDNTFSYARPNYTSCTHLSLGNMLVSNGLSCYFDGLISLPIFWNDVRTQQEIIDNKNIIPSISEQGLIDYLMFDPATAKVKSKINTSWSSTMIGEINWTSFFVALQDAIIPYPDEYQRGENLLYLRNRANQFRNDNGIPQKTWTDNIIVKGYTPIKAVHWNEVEDAINEVYSIIGQNIISTEVKEQFEQVIVPKDRKFQIKDLKNRMKNIARGLRND